MVRSGIQYAKLLHVVFRDYSIVLYGVFTFVLQALLSKLKTGLRVPYDFRVKDAKLVACLQFVTGTHDYYILMGVVEHSEFWEHKMLQGLPLVLAWFTEASKLMGMVREEVGNFSDVLGNIVFEGFAVVLPRLDIEVTTCCGLRLVGTQYFLGIQPCGIVEWLGCVFSRPEESSLWNDPRFITDVFCSVHLNVAYTCHCF